MQERLRRLLAALAGFAAGVAVSNVARPTVGYPREWRIFARANRKRLDAIRSLLATGYKAMGHRPILRTAADRSIYFLGCLCLEDFNEAMVLCGNGYGIGARKILRSLYEHAVTARYLYKHPEEAEAFERYIHVQEHRALQHAKSVYDVTKLLTLERREGIEQAFARVKGEYRWGWSKKDLLTMAREAGDGLDQLYLHCYFDPTAHAHATPMAITSRIVPGALGTTFVGGPQSTSASEALLLAHAVLLLAMRTQNEYLGLILNAELDRNLQEFLTLGGNS